MAMCLEIYLTTHVKKCKKYYIDKNNGKIFLYLT